MSQLLLLNPRRRSRKARKTTSRRRTRSAAQRAATARMLAANRSRRGGRHVVRANPVRRSRRRNSARAYRRNPIGSRARRSFASFRASGVTGMLKAGAIGGVGAVGVDILFGQVARFLPDSMKAPVGADGATNWLYFAAKAAIAVGVGVYGRKVLPASIAEKAANGALVIMAYQIARSFVPASLTMGAYINPGRVIRPGPGNAQLNGMAAYLPSGARVPVPMSATPMRGAMMARR